VSDDPNGTNEANDISEANDDQAMMLPFDDGSMGRLIRQQWHEGHWYFSVVDVIAILTDSDAPRQYWGMLKKRLHDEGASELLTKCLPLKMRALDGKMRATDAADAETMLRIVQSIPSPKAEPIKQWLAQEGAKRLEEKATELTESQKRLLLRGEVAEKNRGLADTVSAAGIVTSRDFAIFQDFGYMGLYNGEKARDIAARKGLVRNQHILDHMGSEELAANWFRITQAEAKIKREDIDNKPDANAAHFAVGKKVRETIADLGGTMPEDLPTPEQSIQQIEHAEQQRIAAERQQPLFPTGVDR
jgi:DNA-damage-inducible protein D